MVSEELRGHFAAAWRERQVLYFCAPSGFGKTAMVNAMLAQRSVCRLEADKLTAWPELDYACEAVLLDNVQHFKNQDWQRKLAEAIRQHRETHFIFLSRGPLPGWLMPFRNERQLHIFTYNDLILNQETINQLLMLYGLELTELQMEALKKNAWGYPLAMSMVCQQLKSGAVYNKFLDAEVRREVFAHFYEAVFRPMKPAVQRLLLCLAPFEPFDVEFARMLTGNSRAGELLGELQQDTSMFFYDDLHRCRFWPEFRDYLLWQQERDWSAEEMKSLYGRAALYYELQEDYIRALDCYVKCGEHNKVSELLIKNSDLHPGLAHYDEMEPYYRTLPRETILASPALMSGMSMLSAICMDYEESEAWYHELEKYAARQKRTDADYSVARGRLAYLDIALPQRNVAGAVDVIKKAAALLTNREIVMPEFSVTSCLPSLMNGGKDFCQWSKTDDFLYQTIRLPVKLLLGRDGIGLPECAIAESKFEKGENVSGRVLDLLGRLDVIQRNGTPDLEFAVIGLLVRLRIDQGEANHAREHLLALRKRFAPQDRGRFLPNIDALLCRVALYEGDNIAVDAWYQEKAPKDLLKLRVMRRYQYLTRVMVEITYGSYQEAQLIMATLRPYFTTCRRVMDTIYLDLLSAICCYRAKEGDWQQPLLRALEVCSEYQFIRPVSQFGVAVLPLLERCEWPGDRDFFNKIKAEARRQATQYPDFLCSRGVLTEPLFPAELNVLRLLCHHKSNAEIGEILGIKLPTVKTHVSNVLRKLGVKNRGAVKDVAQKKHLI